MTYEPPTLNHLGVPLHAGHVQWTIAKVTCFVNLNASLDESLGCREGRPHLTTQVKPICLTLPMILAHAPTQ
jgi:hypothetical protein